MKKTTCFKTDFPIFYHHPDLVYLDNAATAQKPQPVLDALLQFYTHTNANIHRGIYALAEQATQEYERARKAIALFIGAQPHEIIFTKGATEGINLVASSWACNQIKPGDEIVVTQLDHHANLLPWYALAQKIGAAIRLVPVDERGSITSKEICSYITKKTVLVAFTATSHITGAHNAVAEITAFAHQIGARVVVDAAQAIAHQKLDVDQLGTDFLVFSGHKMFGPTGIGVLYIKEDLHEQIPPYQWGGGMVRSVRLPHDIIVQDLPQRLEAGTPPIAQAVGLAAAVDYMQQFDYAAMQKQEADLCTYLLEGLVQFPAVKIIGSCTELKKSGHIVSLYVEGIHAHDVAFYLDRFHIAVRAGNHCAQPFIEALGGHPVVRISFSWYNTRADVDQILRAFAQLMHEFL